VLAPDTEEKLKAYLGGVYKQRGANFKNTIYLNNLLNKDIVPKMARRIMSQRDKGEDADLCIIMPEDLPELSVPDAKEAMEKLNSLVGLDGIKKQIIDHTALVKLNKLRAAKGMYNKMPPMHMVFTGNPGTGKTTMAKYIGEIYHSIGVLSSGHLVETERSKLVGEFIGETEKKTLNTINSAAGGVLFIDEAYNLAEANNDGSKKDFGMRVIETLLTYLSAEDTDMIIILAGYTNEMKRMLESNPGMKSRFPYIFNFEDYTPDQLMQIGKNVLEEEHYTLSAEAEKKMAKYIIHEYENKDEHFGNGRFVTRLVKSHIIPAMSRRLLEKADSNLTMEELTTVEECDIPDVKNSEYTPKEMDEAILSEALERLNCMVGLRNAKQALRDYTTISKINHQQGLLKITPQNLCWDFIGKTGTGKSTVAEILGKILHGLGILKRGHTICINAEELMGTDSYLVLERVVKEAKDGLLFLDMDAPNTSNINLNHIRMWILNKIRENQQTTALVIAQIKASEDMIAQNLAVHGIASYGNAVVFDDYTKQELFDILSFLLDKENHIGIEPEAGKTLQKYIENIKSSETKDSPVNARTILHLSQTIAHIAQLRLAQSGGERMVTTEDVAHFQWDGKTRGKVGYV
jgi:SpoVK/Ycf46/Vps4 family AAA+-type ATPase